MKTAATKKMFLIVSLSLTKSSDFIQDFYLLLRRQNNISFLSERMEVSW